MLLMYVITSPKHAYIERKKNYGKYLLVVAF